MRRAAKVDANQPDIVKALRAIGAGVLHTHTLGKGAPDIVVGFRGACYCLEIKDGTLSPSRQALTYDEMIWHATWPGHKDVVVSVDEALRAIGARR